LSKKLRLDLNSRPLLHLGHGIASLQGVTNAKSPKDVLNGTSIGNMNVPVDTFAAQNNAMIVSYSVQSRNLSRIRTLAAGLLAATLCPASHAFQRITLRNGFSYDCARSESIDGSHVRLFLTTNTAQAPNQAANFIDLLAQSIASIETLPDPPQPVPAPGTALSLASTAEVHDLLSKAGAQHNIDVELLASVVKAESGGRSNAVSRTGARGLMQLMPGTAQQLGVDDAFRPDQNIAGGSAYLDQLLTRYKDNLALALAAYNAGPAAVDRYHGVPPFRETRAYVVRVMNEFKRRKLALEHPQNIASLGSH
jgi:soluble lytic murein transglycosylase-like protein